ncbi:MAG: Uncharacterized metal-dependent hydrolase YcfH [uncultured Microvirga sp.]|uniref:Uncharacterized metal-dependent hydrolase YcfH n=1 Tax=uncultured Microvirga sp. TaxID=412392 RepID=A0A6J4L4T8_9HYPH|nr:MAG: Uncharacterized metal-dependent hydrolase YcfH [uncultured Microvirga sp.]
MPMSDAGAILEVGGMLVDSHCHLDFPALAQDLRAVMQRADAAGVGRIVTISTHVGRYELYRGLAEAHQNVFFTVGTHPHHAGEEPDVAPETLVALARHPRSIGIGEAGLDYHYDRSPRDIQRKVFRAHIAAARQSGLPIVIHARAADEDMIDILVSEAGQGRFDAVLHCFSSSRKLAEVGIELGFYLSFSGILTFKRSNELRAIAASAPRDRLLVETDAPYLAPEPHRGRSNEPSFVTRTASALAAAIGESEDAAARMTTQNFYRLFRKAAAADRHPAATAAA